MACLSDKGLVGGGERGIGPANIRGTVRLKKGASDCLMAVMSGSATFTGHESSKSRPDNVTKKGNLMPIIM